VAGTVPNSAAMRTWCAVIGRSKIAGGKKVDVPNVVIHRQTASSSGKKLTRQRIAG